MTTAPNLQTVLTVLDEGTTGDGDVGLRFSDVEEDARVWEVRNTKESHLWLVYPVTVWNSVDGDHYECLVAITVLVVAARWVLRITAVDPEGMPVAWHEAEMPT